jgi:hypothetical protein
VLSAAVSGEPVDSGGAGVISLLVAGDCCEGTLDAMVCSDRADRQRAAHGRLRLEPSGVVHDRWRRLRVPSERQLQCRTDLRLQHLREAWCWWVCADRLEQQYRAAGGCSRRSRAVVW